MSSEEIEDKINAQLDYISQLRTMQASGEFLVTDEDIELAEKELAVWQQILQDRLTVEQYRESSGYDPH